MTVQSQSKQGERAVQIEGELSTDGSIVYVGGMDLAEILSAALPSLDDLKYQGRRHFLGFAKVRIELTDAGS